IQDDVVTGVQTCALPISRQMRTLPKMDIYCYERYSPDMNVSLGPVFDEFVAEMLETGLYQSQSEILREGLRLLKEREDSKKLRLDRKSTRLNSSHQIISY